MSARLALPIAAADRLARGGDGTLSNPQEAHDAAKKAHQHMKTAAMIEAAEYVRNRPRDVAALHQMCLPIHLGGQRPMVPPPYNFGPPRTRAAALAAREDRKNGVLV